LKWPNPCITGANLRFKLDRIGTRVRVPESGTETKVKGTGAGLKSGRGIYNNRKLLWNGVGLECRSW